MNGNSANQSRSPLSAILAVLGILSILETFLLFSAGACLSGSGSSMPHRPTGPWLSAPVEPCQQDYSRNMPGRIHQELAIYSTGRSMSRQVTAGACHIASKWICLQHWQVKGLYTRYSRSMSHLVQHALVLYRKACNTWVRHEHPCCVRRACLAVYVRRAVPGPTVASLGIYGRTMPRYVRKAW